MTEHVSTSTMERFCLSALPEAELAAITDHLTKCQSCHDLFAQKLRQQRGSAQLNFPLEPQSWLRHDHLEFESLQRIADNELDTADREVIDTHLAICTACREDVASFLAFTEKIDPELSIRYGPTTQEPRTDAIPWWNWWRDLAWRPAYAAALALIGIALVIAALLLRLTDNQNLQTQQAPTPSVSPGVGSEDQAGVPSPSVAPNESPEQPGAAEPVVVLSDRRGTITVDTSGKVSGLDDVPAPTRDEIAKVLLTERLEPPAILKELGGQDARLRGSQDDQPFKLLSPARTVVTSNRPTLKWEQLARATSYQVYVTDRAGNEVAKSDDLLADTTSWTPPKPLKRGEIYTWTVVAVVDGKEVVSPGPAAPEMKFQVLSTNSLQQLNQLKSTRSRLALGVFYAKVGMVSEAEREFQILFNENPRTEKAGKLLREVQSWRRR